MTVSLPILTVLFALLIAIPAGLLIKLLAGKTIDLIVKKTKQVKDN